jgi:hypothetical protein
MYLLAFSRKTPQQTNKHNESTITNISSIFPLHITILGLVSVFWLFFWGWRIYRIQVLIYYWDERDGPNFHGWGFGPKARWHFDRCHRGMAWVPNRSEV